MTAPRISSKERAKLRSQAHRLEAVQHVGTGGVTASVLKSIREAFNTRELIKIRVLESAPNSAYETADLIVAAIDGAQVVQTIGRVLVLFRPQPEEEDSA